MISNRKTERLASPNHAGFNGWSFNTKQINILPFEEAQVEHVHGRSIILSALGGGDTAARKKKFPVSRPQKLDGGAAANCKVDVWIVIFFSPENR